MRLGSSLGAKCKVLSWIWVTALFFGLTVSPAVADGTAVSAATLQPPPSSLPLRIGEYQARQQVYLAQRAAMAQSRLRRLTGSGQAARSGNAVAANDAGTAIGPVHLRRAARAAMAALVAAVAVAASTGDFSTVAAASSDTVSSDNESSTSTVGAISGATATSSSSSTN